MRSVRSKSAALFVPHRAGVVVQRHDGKPAWTVPNAQWDGFREDAITAINRRERRDREAS